MSSAGVSELFYVILNFVSSFLHLVEAVYDFYCIYNPLFKATCL